MGIPKLFVFFDYILLCRVFFGGGVVLFRFVLFLTTPVACRSSQAKGIPIELASMRTQVQSLALLSGLRIWHCCELWCRLQMWLGSGVAVAVA